MSSEEVLGHLCDSLQQAKSAQLNVKYYSWKYACCVALLPKSGYLHYKGMMAMAPVSSKAIHIWDITYRKEGAEPFCLSEALGSVLKKVYFKDYLIQGAQEHVNRTLGPSYKNMDLDTKITMVNAELEKAPKPQEHLIGNNFDAKYFWPQRPWLDELKRLRREKGKMVMVGQAKQLLALRHHAAELLVLLPTRAGNVRAARDSLAQLGTGLPETQLPAVITQFPEAELTQLPSDMENMQAAVSALQVASSDINQVPDIRDMGTDQAPATEATAVQGPEADLTQPPDAVEDLVTEVPAADMADLQNTQTDFVNAPGMGDMGTDQAPATEATAVQGPEADLTQPPDAMEDLVTEVPAADMADLQNTQTDFVNAPGMGDMGTDQAPATEATAVQGPEADLTQPPDAMEDLVTEVPAADMADLQNTQTDFVNAPGMGYMGTDQAPATEATAVQGPEADLTQPPDAMEDLVTEVPAADMADLQNTQTDFVNAPGMGDMGTDQAPATEATAVQGPEADLTQPPDAVEDLVTEVPAADMADLQNTQTDFVNAPGMGDMGTDQAPATEATAVQGPEADLTQPPDAVEDLVTEVPAADMADLQNTQTDFVNAPGMGDMGTDLAPATEATAVQGPEADLTQPPDAMEELGTHLGNSCQGVTVMGQKGGQQVASSSGAGASCHLASTFMVGISADNTGGLTMGDSRASGSQGSGAHVNHSRHSIQLRQRVMTRAVARAVQEGNGTGHGMKRKAADPLESSVNQKIKQSKAPCAKTVEAEGVLRVEDDDDKDDYKTIESTVYRVYSLADVPAALARHGIVIIQVHSLKDTVGPKQLQMALRFAQKNAAPIFQDIPRDEDGNFIPERDMSGTETNFLISDFGTGQRRQIILDGPHPEILADFRGVVERELDMLRTKIMGGQTLHMNQPAILINTQTARQKPVSRQCWHTDLSEGQTGFVAIAAVQKFSLLVFPGSHIEVQECWRLQDLVQKGVISEASFKACLASHSFTAVRIYLDLGDILFMSGHTIHAGDRGTDKHPALRMHWYITDEEKRNETSQIVLYGDDFANRFR
ncbi:hypothetical protein Vretimale_11081 [Volvox reticuliferus]|uniref:Uncharacterized protein n=1 Tax=Volvox reticuliferus TaxID=1737510 RepID=A0A8J4GGL5_9CHLO|nr:hypothetical protein Vretimale_11081 [Volvox reticuliferus]